MPGRQDLHRFLLIPRLARPCLISLCYSTDSATLKQCKHRLLFNSQPSEALAGFMSVLHRWPVIWPSELICKLRDHARELFIGTNSAALKWKSANLFTSLLSDGKEHSFALERAFWFQGCKQCVRVCVYVRAKVCVPRLSKGMKMPSAPMGTPLPTQALRGQMHLYLFLSATYSTELPDLLTAGAKTTNAGQ